MQPLPSPPHCAELSWAVLCRAVPCCIPPYGELTKCSLIWKRFGQRLPNRAHRHEEEQTGDAVVQHPRSYMSSRSSAAVSPYPVPGGSRGSLSPQTWLGCQPGFQWGLRCCLCVCVGSALFLLSEAEEKKSATFPPAGLQRNRTWVWTWICISSRLEPHVVTAQLRLDFNTLRLTLKNKK